jgi:hypothetical protein
MIRGAVLKRIAHFAQPISPGEMGDGVSPGTN